MDIEKLIIEKAISLGASLAGIAGAAAIGESPSHKSCEKAVWPAGFRSVLVLALAHKKTEPELDWWGGEGGTPGNRRLQLISEELKAWLAKELKIKANGIPYQPDKGGIFLKDAAALAGLGTIGANNLLITPHYGPRIRLRALFIDAELKPSGPAKYSPCDNCQRPCQSACPQGAFPAGPYDVNACRRRMRKDEASSESVTSAAGQAGPVIKYCRACELACPAGEVP